MVSIKRTRLLIIFYSIIVVAYFPIVLIITKIEDSNQNRIKFSNYSLEIKNNQLIKKRTFKNKSLALNGFEKEIKQCDFPNQEITKKEGILCLVGDVGVHSQNIALINIKEFKSLNFISITGLSEKSIFSDVPQFEILTKDNNIMLNIYNRNYGSNPMIDTLTDTYVLEKDNFILTNNMFSNKI